MKENTEKKSYAGKKPAETPEDKIKLAFWFIKTCGSTDEAKRALDAAVVGLESFKRGCAK